MCFLPRLFILPLSHGYEAPESLKERLFYHGALFIAIDTQKALNGANKWHQKGLG